MFELPRNDHESEKLCGSIKMRVGAVRGPDGPNFYARFVQILMPAKTVSLVKMSNLPTTSTTMRM